ncbi:uncharacterized protein L969DRAFT_131941 [Mixia osmundae IAM 14324]|uniref:NudC domain-containing protein 1 n=1 Tax=Mixia osmundae (strain CBS 9802 / IAM 14324 / JCM 22182 / KY 12970) TaxID=764103 RepID=G7E000_MIXOS|nr:uncharacterized protein L969DRAFT_131941 [Mixia osmundae IAM 14324]KEI42152.1 hypothetical protein L969DRAFT_131941 [Mixia osmundae IAM 14324]GAA96160.1 hypothetical protein E5Q_02821 [Mixia osmundae IAM 14324]
MVLDEVAASHRTRHALAERSLQSVCVVTHCPVVCFASAGIRTSVVVAVVTLARSMRLFLSYLTTIYICCHTALSGYHTLPLVLFPVSLARFHPLSVPVDRVCRLDMDDFTKVDRNLKNALFEGYKLSPLRDAALSRQALPCKGDDVALPGRPLVRVDDIATYNWRAVRAKAKHNFLCPESATSAVFIDGQAQVWRISLSEQDVAIKLLLAIPLPVSPSTASKAAEYPSIVISDGKIIVADGTGLLYIISSSAQTAAIDASYSLQVNDASLPFSLLGVQSQARPDGTMAYLISYLSEAAVSRGNDEESGRFTLALVTPSQIVRNGYALLDTMWTITGADLPSFVYRQDNTASWIVGASAHFTALGVPADSQVEQSKIKPTESVRYHWSQTSETITVDFKLPLAARAKDINVTFSPQFVTIAPKTDNACLPRWSHRKLWSKIKPDESTWSLEPLDDACLLSLTLEKTESSRWYSIFSPDAQGYEEIDETLDADVARDIAANLDKYTSDTHLDNVPPSTLLGDEVDADIDAPADTPGSGTMLTIISDEGRTTRVPLTRPVELLSLPVPSQPQTDKSIIIRSDVHGFLFKLETDTASWRHTSTFPALAFVLASKRDIKYAAHLDHSVSIAIEAGATLRAAAHANTSGSQIPAGGNAYLYYPPPPGSKARTARSAVAKITSPSSGACIGVARLSIDEKDVIIFLCEQELVTLRL